MTRKYSARSPSNANALAAKTMNASSVTPNTAGIESSANSRSVLPIATSTMNSGVIARRPFRRANSAPPWYCSVTGKRLRVNRTSALSSIDGSSSRCRNSCTAVNSSSRPNSRNMNVNSVQQRGAEQDEDHPQHQREHDADDQRLLLVHVRHRNVLMMITNTNRLSTDRLFSTM